MEEVQNRSEDMDVEDENTQAGMLASDVLGICNDKDLVCE